MNRWEMPENLRLTCASNPIVEFVEFYVAVTVSREVGARPAR